MKKFFLSILSIVTISSMVSAQEATPKNDEIKTVFGNPTAQSIGGFGALSTGYTKINGLDGMYFGARGAVVINHSLALGLGGRGFISETTTDANLLSDYEYAGGYGGFYIEPIIGALEPVHISFPVLIGAGGVGYNKHWEDYDSNDHEYESTNEDSQAFFVLEPSVEIEFNMVKFMRLALTASYRYTSNINLQYADRVGDLDNDFANTRIADADMLRGFNFGVIMKFGKF